MPAIVRGLTEIQAAFKVVDKEAGRELQTGLRQVAEPVRTDAQAFALQKVPRMKFSPQWAKMRTGRARGVVYVAPRQRGARGRGDPRRRGQQFAMLLMSRAMEPALERHAAEIEHGVEVLIDHAVDQFNRGGPR